MVGTGLRKFRASRQKSDILARESRCQVLKVGYMERGEGQNKPETPQFLKDFRAFRLCLIFFKYLRAYWDNGPGQQRDFNRLLSPRNLTSVQQAVYSECWFFCSCSADSPPSATSTAGCTASTRSPGKERVCPGLGQMKEGTHTLGT